MKTHGGGEKRLGEGILWQSGGSKKYDMLRQGELDPFCKKGHLSTVWVIRSRGMQ